MSSMTAEGSAPADERQHFTEVLVRDWIDHRVEFSSAELNDGLHNQVTWTIDSLLDADRLNAILGVAGQGDPGWTVTYSPEGGLRVRLRWRVDGEEES